MAARSELSGSQVLANLERGIIAILRGIKPEETSDIIAALVESGVRAIEIPLNSPDPFRSIEIARKRAPQDCLIGAGTVLHPDEVDRLQDAGGGLVVSPNVDVDVIARSVQRGMISFPGVFTATEALAALRAGADGLKFFPASLIGPAGMSAVRAVLPDHTICAAVGGVGEADFAPYMATGIRHFGTGSSLYKPGMTADEISKRAQRCVAAYDAAVEKCRNGDT